MRSFLTRAAAAVLAALGLAVILVGAGHAQAPTLRATLSSTIQPTWSVDLRAGIPAGATFTRASSRTCPGANGLLATLGTNVPCLYYDPATGQPWGYLAEMQSTNGLLRSEDFTNASWTASGLTPTTAGGTAPDGNNTINKLVESNTNAAHKVSQAVTLATATTAGFSWFVKASSRSKFYISVQASAANYATAVFDTAGAGTTASETSVGGTSGTITDTYIRNVGGSIYRVSIQAKVTGANPTIAFGLASAATGNTFNTTGDVTYAGDGSSFGYGWGTQSDTAGVGVTSYIPTAGSTVTRSADLLSLPLTSLPGWSAGMGGVLVAAYRLQTAAGLTTQTPLSLSDGTDSNYLRIRAGAGSDSRWGADMSSGGSGQFSIFTGTTPAVFARRKTALGWSTSRGVVAFDGGTLGSASGSYSLPVTPTSLYFGTRKGNSDWLNGTLESIAYYAGARTDAFVQQVSR